MWSDLIYSGYIRQQVAAGILMTFAGFCNVVKTFPILHLPLSASVVAMATAVRPQVPPCLFSFTPPLHAVCYSCWSNFKNVPNPLSVLLPQRNTKWIRRDYCLPLPPSRPPLPLLLLWAAALSSSSPSSLDFSHPVYIGFQLTFLHRLGLSLWPREWQVPWWQMPTQAHCILGHEVF